MFTQTLQRLQQNLNTLREREARYAGDAPLALLNQIDDHIAAITLTEQAKRREISEAAWREALEPLLVAIEKRTGEAAAINISDISNSVITIQGSVMANIQAGGDVVGGDKIETHNYYQSPLAPAPASGRCDHYAHIDLPPNFVPRPELLASIKQSLLTGGDTVALTSQIKMSALHGMGGIGKSVLARALCEEPEVQETFNDGILWTTLGQTVTDDDLKAKLRVWIEALDGIISLTAPTLGQLKNSLAEQLAERACLLIVDDMWRYPDAAWFNAGGPDCRLLLTTRDAEAARQLGATIEPVSIMTEAEAVTLLAEWAGKPLSQSDPDLTARIVQRLGYLPLALKLAGEQLRRKSPDQWLATFSAQKLKSRRDESVHGNLFDAFALSLAELTDGEQLLFTSLIIFKEDEPIPPQAIALLWSQLAGYEPDDTEELLVDLADRALLQLGDDQTVTLHDLVRDFMAEQLPEGGRAQAHTALLSAYRATQTGDGWATAPNDGYLYDHLAYHLKALADHDEAAAEELDQLFADDAWLQVRVPADDYRYDGYLADLELAWQRAEQAAQTQIEAEQPLEAIGQLVHYALIESTINTLVNQYDIELIPRAVEVGLWSIERAISVAAKIIDPKKRAELYITLLAVDSSSRTQHQQLIRIGLGAARAIDDTEDRAYALRDLALQLNEAEKTAILREALEAARVPSLKQIMIVGESSTYYALRNLAPHLSETEKEAVLREALQEVQAIHDEKERSKALKELVPQLNEAHLSEALEVARAIKRVEDRAKTLMELTPYLRETEKTAVLNEAIKATRTIESVEDRCRTLRNLALHLSETEKTAVLNEALKTARIIDNEMRRQEALTGLAPHLNEVQLREALNVARAINSQWEKTNALRGLAPHMNETEKAAVLNETLNMVRAWATGYAWHRSNALMELAHHLSGTEKAAVLTEALKAARAISKAKDRASPLIWLARHLSGTEKETALREALQAIPAIDSEWSRVYALKELAPLLDEVEEEGVLNETIQLMQTISNAEDRAKTLVELARHLNDVEQERVLRKAIEAAQSIDDARHRADVLRELAPHLSREHLKGALEAARVISDEEYRAKALSGLVPYLSGMAKKIAIRETLEAARIIDNEWSRVETPGGVEKEADVKKSPKATQASDNDKHRADFLLEMSPRIWWMTSQNRSIPWRADILRKLAPYLSEIEQDPVLSKAAEVARAIDDEWHRADVLMKLAPHLSKTEKEAVLNEALAAARAIYNEWRRADILRMLAPHLNGNQLRNTLEIVRAISDGESLADALIGLVPHLGGTELNKTVEIARSIDDEWHRANALMELAPHLSKAEGEVILNEALEAARAVDIEWRRADALMELAHRLSEKEREAVLNEALEATLTIDYKWSRTSALEKLAPHLSEEQLIGALEAMRAIEDEKDRADALMKLVPHLSKTEQKAVLNEVLEAARAIESAEDRADALRELALHLSKTEQKAVLNEVLEAARAIESAEDRADALRELALHLSETEQKAILNEALETTRAIDDKKDRAYALRELASHFKETERQAVLNEAIETTRAIDDKKDQAYALRELALHLSETEQNAILSEALEAVLTIGYEKDRAKGLSDLAPFLSRTQLSGFILAQVRQLRRSDRSDLLRLLADNDLFNPNKLGLSSETLAAISRSIIDICTKWRWL